MIKDLYNKWCDFYKYNKKVAGLILASLISIVLGLSILAASMFGGGVVVTVLGLWIVFTIIYLSIIVN